MMRRMMSARIDDVAVSAPVDLVRQEPGSKSRELVHALVAAGGPARLEQHDELRRMRVEAPEEFFAKSPDHPRLAIMIEVEVVDETCRLHGAQPPQRLHAGVRRSQDRDGVLGPLPADEVCPAR